MSFTQQRFLNVELVTPEEMSTKGNCIIKDCNDYQSASLFKTNKDIREVNVYYGIYTSLQWYPISKEILESTY